MLLLSRVLVADAYVGTWVTVSQRPRLTETNPSTALVGPSMLLLRKRVQEQHRARTCQASEGFSHASDTLQEEARFQALHVPQVWQASGRER